MTFQSEFVDRLEAEVDVKIRQRTKAMKLFVAEKAFDLINDKWPVWSGYSKANNRININSAEQEVDPPERPMGNVVDIKGMLAELAIFNNAAELTKLDPEAIRYTDTIHIGNAVSYAADVGFEPGQGSHIYVESAREASSLAKSIDLPEAPRFKGR